MEDFRGDFSINRTLQDFKGGAANLLLMWIWLWHFPVKKTLDNFYSKKVKKRLKKLPQKKAGLIWLHIMLKQIHKNAKHIS